MSMAWMRMPGQTWTAAAASFLGMWLLMMAAMMLPSLVPMLWRYRRAAGAPSAARTIGLTTLVGGGYFFVWAAIGLAVFLMGVALTAFEMRVPLLARTTPIAAGAVVLLAGLLQFTAWKAHHLACTRESPMPGRRLQPDILTAWRHGLRLGLHCSYCCIGMTSILLATGLMELRTMALVTAAITLERLAPASQRIARLIGAVTVIAGFVLLARAAGG
ncbi:MAG TPA: DUF2182 domain-containing protein [Gemmatimonadaceae bacterium]|jgi:predicted metal-binding membrane protein|nr:DUF2182 domain-containing protein [Gemmatimonadaceae bacterium]